MALGLGELLTFAGATSLLDFGLSSLGSFMANSASARAAAQSFKYQRALLHEQQEWSERMSNTAHFREVADLRSAGLNPILSATGGSGASAPVVSAPSVSMANMGFHSSNSASSALSAASKIKQVLDNEVDQIKINNKKLENEVEQIKVNKHKVEKDIINQDKITAATVKKLNSEAANLDANTYKTKHRVQLPLGGEIPAAVSDELTNWRQWPGQAWNWYLENVGRRFSNFVENSAKSVVPKINNLPMPSRGRDHWKKDKSDFPIKVDLYKGWKR